MSSVVSNRLKIVSCIICFTVVHGTILTYYSSRNHSLPPFTARSYSGALFVIQYNFSCSITCHTVHSGPDLTASIASRGGHSNIQNDHGISASRGGHSNIQNCLQLAQPHLFTLRDSFVHLRALPRLELSCPQRLSVELLDKNISRV